MARKEPAGTCCKVIRTPKCSERRCRPEHKGSRQVGLAQRTWLSQLDQQGRRTPNPIAERFHELFTMIAMPR